MPFAVAERWVLSTGKGNKKWGNAYVKLLNVHYLNDIFLIKLPSAIHSS